MDTVTIPQAPAPIVEPPLREVAVPKVWIGCPAYGGKIELNFAACLIQVLGPACNCIGDLQFFGGDSLVSRARNNLVSMFMDGQVRDVEVEAAKVDETGKQIPARHEKVLCKFDWLLFLDTDLTFSPQDVQMLYDLAVATGPGIYTGTYPLKTLKPKVVFNPRPGARVRADGVLSVCEGATGFMMIHRDVFTKMKAAHPENDFITDGGDAGGGGTPRHDWFQVGVKRDINNLNPRYLSEDYFFCRKWIDMGGDVLMQTKICANHIGTMTYPVNPMEIIEVADIYRKAAEAEAKAKVALAA